MRIYACLSVGSDRAKHFLLLFCLSSLSLSLRVQCCTHSCAIDRSLALFRFAACWLAGLLCVCWVCFISTHQEGIVYLKQRPLIHSPAYGCFVPSNAPLTHYLLDYILLYLLIYYLHIIYSYIASHIRAVTSVLGSSLISVRYLRVLPRFELCGWLVIVVSFGDHIWPRSTHWVLHQKFYTSKRLYRQVSFFRPSTFTAYTSLDAAAWTTYSIP
ncbi:hypothetical protein F5B17DRAFT_22406 [Nemania serpens]|nr:hypothetical protein F5B17DRAFT_22406 [Nemania serpens]